MKTRLAAALLQLSLGLALTACNESIQPRTTDGTAPQDSLGEPDSGPSGDGVVAVDADAVAVDAGALPDSVDDDGTPDTTPDAGPPEGGAEAGGNSVETILDDMKLDNDVSPLPGAPSGPQWATGPGNVIQGGDPRGSTTPSWWQPTDQSYKSGAYWNAVIGWFVAWDGPGHSAPNTRVQLADFRVYLLLKSTDSWTPASSTTGVGGENFSKNLIDPATGADLRQEPDGSSSLRLTAPYAFHGWSTPVAMDGSDVKGVLATFSARLILDDPAGVDDRASANVVVQCGADYYPSLSSKASDFAPASYFPGSGGSRFKRVTAAWQHFNYASVNAGPQTLDPSTPVTAERALSEAQLRANPPPLQ